MSFIFLLAICLLTCFTEARTHRKLDKSGRLAAQDSNELSSANSAGAFGGGERGPEDPDSGSGSGSESGSGSGPTSGPGSNGVSDCEHRDLYIWLTLLSVGTTLLVIGAVILCKVMRDLKCRQESLKQKITYMEMETILHLPEFQGDEI